MHMRFDSRAINIVVYYRPEESSQYSKFLNLCKSRARTRCIPYEWKDDVLPINKLKNMGIDHVVTTHFIFAENNLSPTSEFLFPSSSQQTSTAISSKLPGICGATPSSSASFPCLNGRPMSTMMPNRRFSLCFLFV